jgi:tRNA (guanine37-N1)-methyltransferase
MKTSYAICCTKGSASIELIKQYLRKNNFFDRSKKITTDDSHLYFPLRNISDEEYETIKKQIATYADSELTKKKLPSKTSNALKDNLVDKVPTELLEKLKTAYDTVGSIAILEIDPELGAYEQTIAQTLLSLQKNIKTVLKKSGIHSGVFRTQELTYVAGVNTKVAEYKENNVTLHLDVEQVYFSPRLSTERKRIMQQVEPNENVLVMFSGCGPYVATIAKNTKARWVTGIEINPTGHAFSLTNMYNNKLANTSLFCGDVKKVIPTLRRGIFGIKSDWKKELLDIKLKENPDIVEFFFGPYDLIRHHKEILDMIDYCAQKNISVYLHIPLRYKEGRFSLVDELYRNDSVDALLRMNALASHYNVLGMVIHPIENTKEDASVFVSEFNKIKQKLNLDKIYFENLPFKGFGTVDEINHVLEQTGVSNLCIDLSHAYLIRQSEEDIIDIIKNNTAKNNYFHIMDTTGEMTKEGDHLPLGEGHLDLKHLLSYAERGMLEIRDDDYANPQNAIASFHTLNKLRGKPTFDRILMPLPKSAEDFLEDAFKVAKKGTIIHFYDFLHVSEIPHVALEKIKRAAEDAGINYSIQEHVRCGQYSPKKYRICVDFRIE